MLLKQVRTKRFGRHGFTAEESQSVAGSSVSGGGAAISAISATCAGSQKAAGKSGCGSVVNVR